ncbi:hypothetical protein ACEYYB_11365 [Paracoccus sp. p4-l81]
MTTLSLHLTPVSFKVAATGQPAIRAMVRLAMTAILLLPLILAG